MIFEIGKRYTFNTLVPSILGDRKDMMKVISICDYTQAMKYADVITKHDIVKPYLTAQLLSKDLQYVVFRNMADEIEVIAYEYINLDSIKLVEKINLIVEIENISSDDISHISEVIRSAGYDNIKISKKYY